MPKESRHKCIMCGKLRYKKYMHKLNNKWICIITLVPPYNYIKFKNKSYEIHICEYKYLQMQYQSLIEFSNQVNNTFQNLFYIDKPPKIVIPELTKMLQNE